MSSRPYGGSFGDWPMQEAFNSKSKNIGELLGANERAQIVVPQFQRGYSWEKKHVESFWKDVVAFQKESAQRDGPTKYFLGPIVVLYTNDGAIQLLDGQQRLATATILFAVMRDMARSFGTGASSDLARAYPETH